MLENMLLLRPRGRHLLSALCRHLRGDERLAAL